MDVMTAIQQRFSVRQYQNKPINDEKINMILNAGRLAPSARNMQEWRFIVVKDFNTRQKLMEAAKGQAFVGQAPVIIVCCAETNLHVMTCGQICYPIDCAIAIDHMTLKAVEEGLGTCWVGAFFEDKVKSTVSIPDSPNIRVVSLLTLGYPAQPQPEKNRIDLKDLVMHEKWHKP
ncbi:MAG: nitroreductase [Elusimicrobia bacterium]|nr:nitroreductase [Elusimicrobiota bacterium]